MTSNLVPFSPKQIKLLTWWHPDSPVSDYEGIIADGSIRAGKTFPMALSFIEWAFTFFTNEAFGMAGKTIGSFSRNVLFWLKPLLMAQGYKVHHRRNSAEGNYLELTRGGSTNRFYIFGGRDESSQDIVQGVTLAGFLFDEVALMPESFVNQATGRCSVEGSKLWFNCNPDSPSHWFKTFWLDKCKDKKLLHLHFTMIDNPSMSVKKRNYYHSIYFGVFFQRYILGLWVMAEGAIYDMWSEENVYSKLPVKRGFFETASRDIAIDYGTTNPMVFLDIYDCGEAVLVDNEYYWDSKKTGRQKTDEEYANDLDAFCGGPNNVRFIIIDPSAASFRAVLRNRGYRVKEADNEVLDGIRLTATCIGKKILKVNSQCTNFIREVGSYVWAAKKADAGKEEPVKANDHAMDAIRYWFKTMFKTVRLKHF